jgi:hypothetical protein
MTNTFSNLGSGVYTVSVKDNNLCVQSTTVTLVDGPAITLSAVSTNPTCSNNLGSISVTSSGGNGSLVNTVNNLSVATSYAAGTYTVNTTDSKNCSVSTLVTLTAPSSIIILDTVVHPTCFGGQGTIAVTVNGGTGAIAVTINNSAIAASYPDGVYTIIATDASSCSTSKVVTVTQPSIINLIATGNNPTCFGTSGSITASATGGTGSISITQNGQPVFGGYAVGTYTILATDANGCNTTQSVTLTSPTAITLTASATNALCYADSGTITASANGGTGTVAITINSASPLPKYPAGIYTVTALDGNSCAVTTIVTISEPNAINLLATATNPTCYIAGVPINATATGGTGTITITVDSLAMASTYTTGTYIVEAKDANSCSSTSAVFITIPDSISITNTVFNPICNGDSGTVTITAVGGTGSLTSTINNALPAMAYAAGIYTVTTQDVANCSATSTFQIVQPAALAVVANASSVITCNGELVTLIGSGAQSYVWSGGAIDNTPFALISNGVYTVTGSDNNGCTNTDTIALIANNGNGTLALSFNNNDSSVVGNGCKTINQLDGSSQNYYDANCNIITSVQDATSGNVLGNVTSCVAVNATVQMHNGQPFAARTYTITPTNQGPATITLYYTTDDILDYNEFVTNSGSAYPLFNLVNNNPANGDIISNASITKLNGPIGVASVASVYPITLTYNATGMRWETTFSIPDFSSFYLHTTNAGNVPLPLDILDFTAQKSIQGITLDWKTIAEQNGNYFAIERANNINEQFKEIGTVVSRSTNNLSGSNLSYTYLDKKPNFGSNFYRLKNVKNSGAFTYSKIIKMVYSTTSSITVYPNPVNDVLYANITSTIAEPIKIKIMDAIGRTIKQIETDVIGGGNRIEIDASTFTQGIYQIRITSANNIDFSSTFIKN